MKRSFIGLLIFIAGCTAIQQPTPNVRGCSQYCYPILTNYLLSLTRTNSNGHSDSWHGGIMTTEAGDVVTVKYDPAICTNLPQNAVMFCWFCTNNLVCTPKQLPSNSEDCDYGVTNYCPTCMYQVSYIQAGGCPAPQFASARMVFENGQYIPVKARK